MERREYFYKMKIQSLCKDIAEEMVTILDLENALDKLHLLLMTINISEQFKIY